MDKTCEANCQHPNQQLRKFCIYLTLEAMSWRGKREREGEGEGEGGGGRGRKKSK